jgi:hypothetical protein
VPISGAEFAIVSPNFVIKSGRDALGTDGEPHFVREYEADASVQNTTSNAGRKYMRSQMNESPNRGAALGVSEVIARKSFAGAAHALG